MLQTPTEFNLVIEPTNSTISPGGRIEDRKGASKTYLRLLASPAFLSHKRELMDNPPPVYFDLSTPPIHTNPFAPVPPPLSPSLIPHPQCLFPSCNPPHTILTSHYPNIPNTSPGPPPPRLRPRKSRPRNRLRPRSGPLRLARRRQNRRHPNQNGL